MAKMSAQDEARALIARLQVACGQLVCGESATNLMREAADAIEACLGRAHFQQDALSASLAREARLRAELASIEAMVFHYEVEHGLPISCCITAQRAALAEPRQETPVTHRLVGPRMIRQWSAGPEVNDGWYYEDDAGLVLLVELADPRRQISAGTIPWRNVKAALKRRREATR